MSYEVVKVQVLWKGLRPEGFSLIRKRETPEQKAFQQRFPFRRLQKYISCVNIGNMSARLIPCLALERVMTASINLSGAANI